MRGVDDPSASDVRGSEPEAGRKKPTGKIRYPRWLWAFGFVGAAVIVGCILLLVQLSDSNATNLGGGAIKQLIPAPNTQILSQNQVGVDLAPGYTGTLALNGIPIADDEVTLIPATNSVLFLPGPGKSVEEFLPGQNCIAATYWKPVDGPATAQRYSWCFTAL